MANNSVAHGLASQLLAGLDMLKDCIDRCPAKEWNESHNDYPYSQVVFHALSDCDYNLCDNEEELKEQAFHREGLGSPIKGSVKKKIPPRRKNKLFFLYA